MYGDQFGGKSFTTIYKREQDKLANQFIAGEDLVAGMPVKLNADGTIGALVFGPGAYPEQKYIGINLYNVKRGEITTVMILVSHVMVYAEAKEEMSCGDNVELEKALGDPSTNPDTEIEHYPHLLVKKATQSPRGVGIVLDNATPGQFEVRVLIFDTVTSM